MWLCSWMRGLAKAATVSAEKGSNVACAPRERTADFNDRVRHRERRLCSRERMGWTASFMSQVTAHEPVQRIGGNRQPRLGNSIAAGARGVAERPT